MPLEAIQYSNGTLRILDQLLLPAETKFIQIQTVQGGWHAIRNMQVRGAPAIAVVGCLSLAVELYPLEFDSVDDIKTYVTKQLDYLVTARPTAINMKNARDELVNNLNQWCLVDSATAVKSNLIHEIESMLTKDVESNKTIGKHGADTICNYYNSGSKPLNVLTHCNTGSLATVGYGTALGVVRSLHSRNKLARCFCTETRPYNQGARLTAFELVHDSIPATLICDSMAGALMAQGKVDAVVTGADHVTLNGDTANKIGTYSLAVLAKHHNIPFYIAVPLTSVNPKVKNGSEVHIEDRPAREMTHVAGNQIAASGIECWNPAFDVTPAELITGLITERGTFTPKELQDFLQQFQ